MYRSSSQRNLLVRSIFFTSFVLLSLSVSAQINTSQVVLGAHANDQVGKMFPTQNGFVFAGNTYSYGAGGQDIYLFESDVMGNVEWSIAYGGQNNESAAGILKLEDGSHVITGRTTSFGKGDIDLYFSRINAGGEVTHFKTYGGSAEDRSMGMIPTRDGQFLLFGSTRGGDLGNLDIIVLKVTEFGDVIWSRIYGGPVTDVTYAVKETPQGEYIVFAYTNSWEDLYGPPDVYLLKLDVNGNMLWNKSYGGAGFELMTSSEAGFIAENGDMYMLGATNSFGVGDYDQLLIKFDSLGEIVWARTIGGTGYDYGRTVKMTSEGRLLVSGFITDPQNNSRDGIVCKFSVDGDLIWSRTYGDGETDDIYSIYENADASLFAVGVTQSFGGTDTDIWFINMDSEGNSDCNITEFVPTVLPVQLSSRSSSAYKGIMALEISEIDLSELTIVRNKGMHKDGPCDDPGMPQRNRPLPREFKLAPNSPNPFNPSTSIRFDIPYDASVNITIFNVKGQQIIELINEDYLAGSYIRDWDGKDRTGQDLASGIYICRIVAGEFRDEQQLLLMR
ncbi:MAG: T9SS type A sorting domain-containing protein [Candidatus Marinimicrobia bacterium]|nr:T9SS type A sorting domain-containing protein [Candidatus Neomarinimicrobiota bacterium]MBT3576476.1 T9SS type A sorting domain-containing protein [Candidatus Neomarinimicrobiota bacterium]MBT3681262.1 T9SS type A sorting domain-containing protein [Candidatus Neomarinimicrobiota bacterium]MBT4130853.1 T9SS type A sorting domain-containing protein [Candidatus Neomarinimicrobiota bacterium]MBT4295878.1 T9SS type A sorting domain-containing protein [Candidatus Neomarinimicrobiota bacterium]